MIRKTLFITALIIAATPSVWAQEAIAIRGGRLLTVSHGVIENGTVLVVDGKIKAVGASVSIPPGAQVIDAAGKVVIPGMIDAGDRLGLVEIPAEQITDDATEYDDPIHPELRVLDALNPGSELFRVTRAQGITNAVSTPANGNLIAGQGAVITLGGETVQQLVVESPAALVINLGEASKMTYGPKGKPPETRMGQMAMLRQEFLNAQHYRAELKAYANRRSDKNSETETKDGEGSKPAAPPAKNLKFEALAAALDGKLPVVIRANRVSDIEMALRLADEFHLRIILADAAAAWRLAGQLAEKKIPVIVGPILEEPASMETLDVRLENAAILHRAGVPIAIQTNSSNEVRDLPFDIEYAIANGLPEDAALAAVTLNPARFFGFEDRLGSLDEGKQANLVVLDGMPFHVKTHVVTELINGKVMDLSNRQTELYEFYKKKYGIQ
ncbi:MAG TPA: amidohydrolase family protein [Terriglobia bacterium]|nr:amidohydrolase family protein [Terriglobia bacterium]